MPYRAVPVDVVVIGSGPNGLAAAIELARAGLEVTVIEAADTLGGGLRTAELTLPGFLHDVCSACHPMGVLSPVFRSMPLGEHGLEWVRPEASVAHPLDGEPAVLLRGSPADTAAELGPDGDRYRRMVEPFLDDPEGLIADLLAPLGVPRRPLRMARFGLYGAWPATWLGRWAFRGERARALLAGCAAHSIQPLSSPLTAALGLVFLLAGHLEPWPVARGGSAAIGKALVSYFESLGGRVVAGLAVTSLDQLPPCRAVVFDTDPVQLADIAGDQLPPRYARRLRRYRFGPGAFKLDWALSEPIPWADPRVGRAATVHLGGTMAEIAASERAMARGEHPERPYVLMVQQSALDPSRAPPGRHTGYGYVHVPAGSTVDRTAVIEDQIERFAPGFRDVILARRVTTAVDFARYNRNYVGGAVTGGTADLTQLFTRPVARLDPYTTPNPKLFVCSASTPPGGGVHGMGGYHAARSVLRRLG
ncbi:MAG: NAD(P)/FAD-dependent oxidoreductase [Myxococcota bacterium]